MYPAEFETAEGVYSRVDEPLFLGLPPLLALILFLLLLAIAVGMFFLGRWHMGQTDGTDADKAPGEIYAVIKRYASDARSASSNELKQKAEVLERKIDQYLGPVIVVGKELGGLTKALKQAGEGKIEEPAKPEAKTETRPESRTCTCGGTGGARVCACGAVPAQPVSINQVYIGGAPVATPPAADTPPPRAERDSPTDRPAPPKTVKRDMTHAEQIDALDKAVRAFNDYWHNKEGRVAELKAAQRALNRRPPSSDLSDGHSHTVGGRH
ncbi:hypothetical protein ACETK8_03875 [Brevundimonas staleyi]|uniref:Uncharacterized protein n=1 Tax=Brevundimonas staleyi TaxID=74326 RepID=A0ABW0FV64_9CAUL